MSFYVIDYFMVKPNISGSLNISFHDILKCEERRYKAYG